ncbi:accessory gene regulator ArgB-like protein [Paenibacillus sp. 1P07SE]|uniref:accessory gene regulator ArgB-like protein n=1 Tax=Paenibacillus sp. 1P07SE TaxID=3132209 RepID=UPI0039A5C2D6
MITFIARRLAMNLKAMVPNHPASVEVLRFALEAIVNGVLIVGLSLLVSWPLGVTQEVAIALVMFAVLRQMSGGYHLKSGIACVIVSTAIILLVSLVPLDKTMIWVANAISVLLCLLFAPSKIEKQTRIPPKYFPILKISSSILVAANFLIGSSVLAATFLVQSLSLVHFGAKGGTGK